MCTETGKATEGAKAMLTIPETEDESESVEAKRAEYWRIVRATIAELARRWPNLFRAHPMSTHLPLKIGVSDEVKSLAPDIPEEHLNMAFKHYVWRIEARGG